MDKQIDDGMEIIVALNTLRSFCRAARGRDAVFFDSPNRDFFDGSAEGYWERRARVLGATEQEIAGAKE